MARNCFITVATFAAIIAALVVMASYKHSHFLPQQMRTSFVNSRAPQLCVRRSLIPFDRRDDIGILLEGENAAYGVEVGVQNGFFSKQLLKTWPSAKKLYLVDLWGHQENYADMANAADDV